MLLIDTSIWIAVLQDKSKAKCDRDFDAIAKHTILKQQKINL